MEGWKRGLWETICCQSLEITTACEGVLFPSLVSERWANVSLTAGLPTHWLSGLMSLLSLFALLILLNTVAIQIRAYGPLGSQEGGQPQLVAQECLRVCMSVCGKIDTTSHSGEGIGCSSLCFCTSIFLWGPNVLTRTENWGKYYVTESSSYWHVLRFNHDSSACLLSLNCVHCKIKYENVCHILRTRLLYKIYRTSHWEWLTEEEKAKAVEEIGWESFQLHAVFEYFEGILSFSTNLSLIHIVAPQ